MTTVVVYKTDTKEVLAAIPMDGGDAVCRIVLAENKFMIKMEGNNNEK